MKPIRMPTINIEQITEAAECGATKWQPKNATRNIRTS